LLLLFCGSFNDLIVYLEGIVARRTEKDEQNFLLGLLFFQRYYGISEEFGGREWVDRDRQKIKQSRP
jgi:hypothetical protein